MAAQFKVATEAEFSQMVDQQRNESTGRMNLFELLEKTKQAEAQLKLLRDEKEALLKTQAEEKESAFQKDVVARMTVLLQDVDFESKFQERIREDRLRLVRICAEIDTSTANGFTALERAVSDRDVEFLKFKYPHLRVVPRYDDCIIAWGQK